MSNKPYSDIMIVENQLDQRTYLSDVIYDISDEFPHLAMNSKDAINQLDLIVSKNRGIVKVLTDLHMWDTWEDWNNGDFLIQKISENKDLNEKIHLAILSWSISEDAILELIKRNYWKLTIDWIPKSLMFERNQFRDRILDFLNDEHKPLKEWTSEIVLSIKEKLTKIPNVSIKLEPLFWKLKRIISQMSVGDPLCIELKSIIDSIDIKSVSWREVHEFKNTLSNFILRNSEALDWKIVESLHEIRLSLKTISDSEILKQAFISDLLPSHQDMFKEKFSWLFVSASNMANIQTLLIEIINNMQKYWYDHSIEVWEKNIVFRNKIKDFDGTNNSEWYGINMMKDMCSEDSNLSIDYNISNEGIFELKFSFPFFRENNESDESSNENQGLQESNESQWNWFEKIYFFDHDFWSRVNLKKVRKVFNCFPKDRIQESNIDIIEKPFNSTDDPKEHSLFIKHNLSYSWNSSDMYVYNLLISLIENPNLKILVLSGISSFDKCISNANIVTAFFRLISSYPESSKSYVFDEVKSIIKNRIFYSNSMDDIPEELKS